MTIPLTKMKKYQNAGLILGRRKNEDIYVIPTHDPHYRENSIKITIAEIRGSSVLVGINAGEKYFVYRKEVLEAMEANPGELEQRLKLTDGAGI